MGDIIDSVFIAVKPVTGFNAYVHGKITALVKFNKISEIKVR